MPGTEKIRGKLNNDDFEGRPSPMSQEEHRRVSRSVSIASCGLVIREENEHALT